MFLSLPLRHIGAALLLVVGFVACGPDENGDTGTDRLIPDQDPSSSSQLMPKTGSNHVLTLSDIHFSPYHDKSIFNALRSEPYTAWDSIFNTSTDTIFSTYAYDSNYALFKSTLEKMKQESPDPEYIMISGDFLAHHYEDSFEVWSGISHHQDSAEGWVELDQFIEKTIRFLAHSIETYYPNTPVYAALGNNDAYCGDYLIQPGGTFLQMFADAFGPLMHHQSGLNTYAQTFPKGGYFAMQSPKDANLRMIVLNTILFNGSFNNPWNPAEVWCSLGDYGPDNQTPGNEMLAWLDAQLTEAAAQGQEVWMMQHIPAGVNVFNTLPSSGSSDCLGPNTSSQGMFFTEYFNGKYLEMIQKHHGVITLNIAGHYHKDDFRIFMDSSDTNPVSWLHVLPSISPIYDNNPGFQVAELEANQNTLSDYTCYYVNVKAPVSSESAWATEYRFSDIYGTTGLNTANMYAIHSQLKTDTALQHQYLYYYPVADSASYESRVPHVKYFVCGQSEMTIPEFEQCVCGSSK